MDAVSQEKIFETRSDATDISLHNGVVEKFQQTNGLSQEKSDTISIGANFSYFVSMPLLQQCGKVFVGPGAEKEAQALGLGLTKLRSYQKDDLEKAKRFSIEQSVKHVLMKQQVAYQHNQQKISMFTQALSLMARVYIGSISFEIREDQIKQAFSVFGPIKSINMSYDASTGYHKGFAFLEYEVPEGAQLAQDNMNGRLMGGRNLKVGRAQTMPQAQPIIDMIMSEAINYHRIYVSSVHPDLSEQDLRSVFSSFGEITKCQLAKQSTGKGHRGFGYIDFTNAKAVKESMLGMNGFDLGGQFLQVGKCITPPDALTYLTMQLSQQKEALPSAAAIAAATATARIQAREILEKQEPREASNESPKSVMEAGITEDTTNTLCLMPTNEGASSPSHKQGTKRRGFGGFSSTIPPPSLVQNIPASGLVQPVIASQNPISASNLSTNFNSNQPFNPSSIVLPASFASSTLAKQLVSESKDHSAQPDSTIDSFYSMLQDPTIKPTPISNSSFSESNIVSKPLSTTQQVKPKKKEKEKKDILSRIGERLEARSHMYDSSKPASFGEFDPFDDSLESGNENNADGAQLMITGVDAQRALAVRNDGTLNKVAGSSDKNKKELSKHGRKGHQGPKRRKIKPPKRQGGPKLNTVQAMAAANIASSIGDQLQAANTQNDEASLASQEHVQIRGNDQRHFLIQKLMRTNRSSVIVLKNMVEKAEVDEYLEEEIREECSKFGIISDVVIVTEQDSEHVKIFVRFGEPVQADEAKKALDGRWFGGRKVAAQNYDQTLFEHDDFSA